MKAVFFARHNNDFDSLVAVADAWTEAAPDNQALIYVATPALKWRGDFRTRMLARNPRIAFTDIWEIAGRAIGRPVDRLWQTNKPDRRFRRRMLEWATEAIVRPGFERKLVAFLEDYDPDIIAFDWWNVPKRRKPFDHFGYQATIAWTRAADVPLISLPHGMMLYEGRSQALFTWQTPYDRIFMENDRRKAKFLVGGHPESQIAVCGAPRYEPAWVERLLVELRGPDAPENEDGLARIVFFDKRHAFYFDFREHLDWLTHLAGHPKVRLTIQPHPRGQKLASLRSLMGHPRIVIDAETPASLLIDRNDIVSTLTSSVMVEAVIRGREILYPKFLSTVTTRFQEAGACVVLESAADTHGAIDRFLAGERVPREKYDAFLKEVAFGGGDPHTRGRITGEMMRIAREFRARRHAGEQGKGPVSMPAD